MDPPSQSARALARRLLVLEAANQSEAESQHEAARVFEKLRISLARFAGPDGFTTLLRRALALARKELPSLQRVEVKADGSLDGFEQVVADASNGGTEAALTITAQLLGLLFIFVGESLTLRLVRDAWPDESLTE
jgi:hypothetical protein